MLQRERLKPSSAAAAAGTAGAVAAACAACCAALPIAAPLVAWLGISSAAAWATTWYLPLGALAAAVSVAAGAFLLRRRRLRVSGHAGSTCGCQTACAGRSFPPAAR
jgi:hypothetical protein